MAKTKTLEPVVITKIKTNRIMFNIVGVTPLYMHRQS